MAWKVSADPLDFEEAIAWFRKRVPMTKAQYEALGAEARRRGFFVSHAAHLDVVTDTWKAIDAAVAKGTKLEDFKKEVGAKLRAAWSPQDVPDPAWRLETIFRQNVQNAYSAGRYRQAVDPDVLADRPVWMFDAILDDRTTSICAACDGTKLEAGDRWWQTHQPPLHFNCRSNFITLTKDQAGDLTKRRPKVDVPAGFGEVVDPEATPEWFPEKLAAAPSPIARVAAAGGPPPPPAPPPGGGSGGGDGEKPKPPWHTDGKKRPRGKLDENEQKLLPAERKTAERLLEEGNDVKSRSQKAKTGRGKKFDAWVNGIDTEFKNPDEVSGVRRLILKSTSGGVAQAPNIIVDARGLAFSASDAEALNARIWPQLEARLDYIRIIGDTFDLTFANPTRP